MNSRIKTHLQNSVMAVIPSCVIPDLEIFYEAKSDDKYDLTANVWFALKDEISKMELSNSF